MFDIVSVSLEDFRSYKGKHQFKFPTKPGLYCLTGRNKLNPRLGANDCGKTTLLEAIFWCLYGKTTRGLKAKNIINWGGKKGSKVLLKLRIGEHEHNVIRTQSPNSLQVDGKTYAQSDIETLLHLSPESFVFSILLPQFGRSFLDIPPAEKLSLFSRILELEYWLGKSSLANEIAKDVAEEISSVKQNLARVQGQIDTTEKDLGPLRIQDTDFRARQSDKITQLQSDLTKLVGEARGRTNDLRKVNNHLLTLEAKLVTASNAVKTANEALRKNTINFSVLEDHITQYEKALNDLNGLEGACPTCLQKVSKTHLEIETLALDDKLLSAKSGIILLKDHGKELGKRASVAEDDLTSLTRNQRDWEREKADLMAATRSSNEQNIRLQAQIKEETNRANPYAAMIKEKTQQLAGLTQKQDGLKKQAAAYERDHAAVSFWVNGFKRVRLFIIEETLRQLEIEVNNNLANLGLPDWHIEFDVERENLAGGVTKGFIVQVYAPGRAEPVPFEAWGGGVTQRLRLAGDLGLANLILTRAGLQGQIEFYDKPSEHLSNEGLIDMAETLKQQATEQGKRIWLIDHRTIDFGGFSQVLVATKDEDGSHLGWDDE